MLVDSRLILGLTNGQDSEGNPIKKTKSFNNIKPAATDQQLTMVVSVLAPLQAWDLVSVDRTNVHSLL
ncbi:hypothetical protein JCM9140_3331 [Halalkalibacter wakoensis JCM 9140]|uniref:DUF1659 domain-containing protein n=1 Tax=Halalkalibacter wakoensis JCM 9140 TaxID=1236970 RepID=W4Q742_9BACI|nr:DUF1659 domain-containing protein [Halalkalibacter wakoensis]GAE27204.1 hypothetical protein JCM9140_3331 [Halalkalibacter wakoensis JCM 9140]